MGIVKYLLDTQTFLWAARESVKLSVPAKKAIEDENSEIFVSPITAYEIMNKYRIGKLPEYAYIAENYLEILHNFGAEELLISTKHLHFAGKFEWSHRDPFDRMLAAQAFTENMTLISSDPEFNDLPWLSVLW
jgi:PIN domain nuclease of toxin-antitoxin system